MAIMRHGLYRPILPVEGMSKLFVTWNFHLFSNEKEQWMQLPVLGVPCVDAILDQSCCKYLFYSMLYNYSATVDLLGLVLALIATLQQRNLLRFQVKHRKVNLMESQSPLATVLPPLLPVKATTLQLCSPESRVELQHESYRET